MNVFTTDMRRALGSGGFRTGVIALAACLLIGNFSMAFALLTDQEGVSLEAGGTISLLLESANSDIVLAAIPILCSLAYTSAFTVEMKTRYYRYTTPRTEMSAYRRAKILSCGISGGLTALGGLLLGLAVFLILFFGREEAPVDASEYTLTLHRLTVAYFGLCFLFFLCGSFWSLVGMTASIVTDSVYVAFAAPFILYYMLVILTSRYFPSLYTLNPQQWVNPDSSWVGGTWGVSLILVELCTLLGIALSLLMERRLKDA